MTMRPVQKPDAEFDWQPRDEAELAALKAAVEEALADPMGVPHEEVVAWLKQLEAGNFDAPMPVPRLLS
ncbi:MULTISPECIES: hypothetical protein [Niveispirillum]|uniref:Uncharacterized protein n=2 Tax=Niveispirillum TaxID=1543704 RepID=A0A255YTS4_9PROT|nr:MULTISPECIES: hypothetical protein [Niveispirillum]OYQ32612.1 hypothetical protein CHU95_17700 [Niveispirillum lacus]GGE59640.1 hypothetical protein GCM10011317_16760 [Niveispirillum cyanobacteriorum]